MARYVIRDQYGKDIVVDDFKKTANGEVEYIEPYTHHVKTVKGEYVRDAEGGERGFLGGLFQGPTFRK